MEDLLPLGPANPAQPENQGAPPESMGWGTRSEMEDKQLTWTHLKPQGQGNTSTDVWLDWDRVLP